MYIHTYIDTHYIDISSINRDVCAISQLQNYYCWRFFAPIPAQTAAGAAGGGEARPGEKVQGSQSASQCDRVASQPSGCCSHPKERKTTAEPQSPNKSFNAEGCRGVGRCLCEVGGAGPVLSVTL